MAVIANLDIILGARTEKAEKSLRKASTVTDSLTRSVKNLVGAYLSFRTVQAAISSVGDAFEEIDKIAKAAQRIDIPVAEMQAFAHAADLAGGDLATVTKAVSVMQRRLSEATLTTPLLTSLRPFQQLGIDLQQFRGLSATNQFQTLADKIAGVANASDRARIAQELFGRGGSELLPLLRETGTSISAATEFLREHGLAISDIDASKIEDANDAWTRTAAAIKDVRNELAILAAGPVEFAAEEVRRIVDRMHGREAFNPFLFSLVEMGARIDEFANRKPVKTPITETILDDLEEIDDTAAKVLEDMEKRAERFGVALRTPLEEFRAELEELRELSPLLSMENVRRGSTAAIERFRQSLERNEPIAIQANISAAERGSQEAATRLLRQTFENDKDIQQDMLSAEQEAARVLNDILFETRKRVIALIPAGF